MENKTGLICGEIRSSLSGEMKYVKKCRPVRGRIMSSKKLSHGAWRYHTTVKINKHNRRDKKADGWTDILIQLTVQE